jgi:hypothetical protein
MPARDPDGPRKLTCGQLLADAVFPKRSAGWPSVGGEHVLGSIAEARIDLDSNRTKVGIISSDGCCVGAFVIPANEKTMIALHKAMLRR